MFQSVINVCIEHQTVWQNNSAFANVFNTFQSKVEAARLLIENQLANSKGKYKIAKITLKEVIEKAVVLGSVVAAHAKSQGLVELEMSSYRSVSDWNRGNSVLRISRLRVLQQNGINLLQELAPYDIDQTFMDDFHAKIDAYEMAVENPRVSIIERKEITRQFAEKLKEIDDILRSELDRILIVFNTGSSDFVHKFKNARTIIDLKGKKNKTNGEKPNSDLPNQDEVNENLD